MSNDIIIIRNEYKIVDLSNSRDCIENIMVLSLSLSYKLEKQTLKIIIYLKPKKS